MATASSTTPSSAHDPRLSRLFWKECSTEDADDESTFVPQQQQQQPLTSTFALADRSILLPFAQLMDEDLAQKLQAEEEKSAMEAYLNEVESEDLQLALSLSASLQDLHRSSQLDDDMYSMEPSSPSLLLELPLLIEDAVQLQQEEQEQELEQDNDTEFDFIEDELDSMFDDLVMLASARAHKMYSRKYSRMHCSVKHLRCPRELLEKAFQTKAPIVITEEGLSPFSREFSSRMEHAYGHKPETSSAPSASSAPSSESPKVGGVHKKPGKNSRFNRQNDIAIDDDAPSEATSSPRKDRHRNRSGLHGFDHFRYVFFQHFRQHIVEPFESGYGVNDISLLNVSPEISNRFMKKMHDTHLTPTVCFHGTDVKNHSSICSKGLIIPNNNSGIRVANGSAYGVGIYTSRTASYSTGYTRGGNSMLVCAVLDDCVENSFETPRVANTKVNKMPEPLPVSTKHAPFHKSHHRPSTGSVAPKPKPVPSGRLPAWKYCQYKNGSSKNVRCHSNIVVLFDPSFVVPVFKISYQARQNPAALYDVSETGAELHALVKKARRLRRREMKKENQKQRRESSSSLLYSTFRRNPVLWL